MEEEILRQPPLHPPPPPPRPRSGTDEAWIKQVCRKVDSAGLGDRPGDTRTIFRVPRHIRRLDLEAYEPTVTCFGPFHHTYPYSSSVMEDHKWRCVRHLLLLRHGSQVDDDQLLGMCLSEVKKQANRVRSCYSEELPRRLDDKKLALMMLLDGCFIIYLMLKMWPKEGMEDETTEEDESKKRGECMIDIGEGEVVLNMGKGDEQQLEVPHEAGQSTFSIVVYDVLKLENQIPFFIIQLLFDKIKPCEDEKIDLVDLALLLFKDIHPQEYKSFKKGHPTTTIICSIYFIPLGSLQKSKQNARTDSSCNRMQVEAFRKRAQLEEIGSCSAICTQVDS